MTHNLLIRMSSIHPNRTLKRPYLKTLVITDQISYTETLINLQLVQKFQIEALTLAH
jgi:hypothetical protein